ncbi:MAG: oligosaccharide flippase family protein [Prevotella sp.]|nr:oligosaccharide flippase family protein [Prevotella sp.]
MTVVINVMINIITMLYARKWYPDYVCRGKISADQKQKIKKNVFGLMISKIGTATRTSIDSVFISAVMGLTAVAIYNNYYYIMSGVSGFLSIITTSLSAGVGNNIVVNTLAKNHSDMKNMMFVFGWLTAFCTSCLVGLYQPFMYMWQGGSMILPNYTMLIFCLYFALNIMGIIPSVYYTAAGLFWEMRYASFLEAIANIVLNFIFVHLWGIFGIVLATVVSIFVFNNIFVIHVLYKFLFKGFSKMKIYKEMLGYYVMTLVSSVIVYFLCDLMPLKGLGHFGIRILICLLIPNILFFIVYHKNERTKWMFKMLIQVKGIIKK